MMEMRQKSHSTIQHSTNKMVTGGDQASAAAYQAIGSIEDSRVKLAQGGGFTSPRNQYNDQGIQQQNVNAAATPDLESIQEEQQQQVSNNQTVPWQQHTLNLSRAESRGSELAVHLQNFGLRNSPTNSAAAIPGSSYQPGPAMMIQQSSLQQQYGYDDSEKPPTVEEEYQQPTYESYYARQAQSLGQQNSNIQPINPFASIDAHSSHSQHQPPAPVLVSKHQPTLASVSEEQEDLYVAAQKQTKMIVPPQPLLQTKQHQRGPVPIGTSQPQYGDTGPPLAQQQQQEPPQTIDEMVRQNQRIIAEKAQRGRANAYQANSADPGNIQNNRQANLQTDSQSTTNAAQQVNPNEYQGQEQDLVKKYAEVNLMDKDSFDSRQARFQMGIGMPEARALLKRTNGGSFRQQVEWFAETCANSGQSQAFSEVKQAVCSAQNTQKLVSLYVLAAHQFGFPMGDYFQ